MTSFSFFFFSSFFFLSFFLSFSFLPRCSGRDHIYTQPFTQFTVSLRTPRSPTTRTVSITLMEGYKPHIELLALGCKVTDLPV